MGWCWDRRDRRSEHNHLGHLHHSWCAWTGRGLAFLGSAGLNLDSAVNHRRVPEVERRGDEAGGSRRDGQARI